MNASSGSGAALSALAAGVDRAALGVMQQVWLSDGDPTRAGARPDQSHTYDTYTDPALIGAPMRFFPEPDPAVLRTRWWMR